MLKLLTLNTHSLEEENMEEKEQILADTISELLPDVVALQEVNQSISAPILDALPETLVPGGAEIPFRKDNYAQDLARRLERNGTPYFWTWLPIKIGYSKYDEGLSFFSRKPILEIRDLPVSRIQDYRNAQTRRILGIRTEDGWFYSIHLSWWNDDREPFLSQWKELSRQIDRKGPIFLMGDFNGDAAVRHESYDAVAAEGWYDTYCLTDQRDPGWTISGQIDGWENEEVRAGRRIDQIWMSQDCPVITSRVLFNGLQKPVISDHFAVYAELETDDE